MHFIRVNDFDNPNLTFKLSLTNPVATISNIDLEYCPSGITVVGSMLLLRCETNLIDLLNPQAIYLCLQRSNIYAYWVRHNWQQMIEFTFKKGVDVVNDRTNGEIPLHLAIKYKHYDLAKKLVEIGANLDQLNDSGHTALEQAVIDKDTKLIKLLLELGASPEITNADGLNAIDFAADPKLIAMLLDSPEERGARALCSVS